MIITDKRLKDELNVFDFLELIIISATDLSERGKYIQLTSGNLESASRTTRDTIKYCEEHGFIKIDPVGKRCSEYFITEKGYAFYNANKNKEA